jgi:outer membrane protein TolC
MRSAIASCAILIFAVTAATPAYSQTVTFPDLLGSLSEENPDLRATRGQAALAALSYESVLDAARPRLSLSADPAYGYSKRRATDFTTLGKETTTTHSVGAGLTYEQLLPTSGSLTATAGTKLEIAADEDDEAAYSLSPSLTVRAAQPLFVGGDLFDGESRRLAETAARIGKREAEALVDVTENRLVRQLAGLYVQAIAGRQALALQERRIALAQRIVENARINAEQGGGSQSNVLRQQVALGSAKSALLDAESGLLEVESQMSNLVGRPISVSRLSDELPTLRAPTGLAPQELAPQESDTSNYGIRRRELSLARAKTRAASASRNAGATLSLSLLLSPRYQDSRESKGDLSGAVSDFSGEGAGVDVQFSTSVTVPLLAGAENQLAERRARIETDLARMELETARTTDARRLELLRRQREILGTQQDLLRRELSYQAELVAREEVLLQAGSSTTESLERAMVQEQTLRNQLWRVSADRFLVDLEIADLTAHNLSDIVVY